jgi:hypothetical protein
VFVWNRTRKERNPETGRKTSRPRPESEWIRVEVPEWRLFSEELWKRVEAQIQRVNKRFGVSSVGGYGRMGRGPKYLFRVNIYLPNQPRKTMMKTARVMGVRPIS